MSFTPHAPQRIDPLSLFPQTVYDQYFITLYNIVYTSLPVLAMGVFDQVSPRFIFFRGGGGGA